MHNKKTLKKIGIKQHRKTAAPNATQKHKNYLTLRIFLLPHQLYDYTKYILHPKNNVLLYLITDHNSPTISEVTDDEEEITRTCVPILLSKPCNNQITLTINNVNKYITDIVKQLKIIHSKNYIHSDFKLINTVLCKSIFKIIDWGSLTKSNTMKVLETTYLLPFLATVILYRYKYIDSINYINSWEELKYIESLYKTKILASNFVGQSGWHYAILSYNLFYTYYKSSKIDIGFLNKKNDEYALGYEIYKCLLQYIDADSIYNRLLNLKSTDDKYTKTIKYLYYLISPEYLSLQKI